MQAKVIKSLSNIETLMVNKLNNTSKKLSVLQTSERKDVIHFMGMDNSTPRKRSSSKLRNRLRNIHSIDNDASSQKLSGRKMNPPMLFNDRAATIDVW